MIPLAEFRQNPIEAASFGCFGRRVFPSLLVSAPDIKKTPPFDAAWEGDMRGLSLLEVPYGGGASYRRSLLGS